MTRLPCPIVQLALTGEGLSEADLFDDGLQFVRPRLANVKGASVPLPFGGKVKQVMVDADPNLLYARHLSATDVSQAINQQNLILPAGTARMGDREFVVKTNSSPDTISALNDLPIRASNGAVVYVKDVAQVHMGYARADQYRAAERQAQRAVDCAEERRHFHAGYCEPDQSDDPAASRGARER